MSTLGTHLHHPLAGLLAKYSDFLFSIVRLAQKLSLENSEIYEREVLVACFFLFKMKVQKIECDFGHTSSPALKMEMTFCSTVVLVGAQKIKKSLFLPSL